jgi:hypothetical protein
LLRWLAIFLFDGAAMSPHATTSHRHAEPPFAAAHQPRVPALPDRASQVIALTARVWGLRPQAAH